MEGIVEKLEGDFSLTPFGDLGFGAPSSVTEGEPELGVVGAEREETLGGAGEGGDLRGTQK